MGSSWLEKLLEIRPEEVPDRPVKNPVLCYKTRTVKSGSMVEVECYPVYEYRYRRELERTRPTSAAVGSRPRSCRSRRRARVSLLMVSTMCTGTRIVRAWSAMAREMAWRIHHVA